MSCQELETKKKQKKMYSELLIDRKNKGCEENVKKL